MIHAAMLGNCNSSSIIRYPRFISEILIEKLSFTASPRRFEGAGVHILKRQIGIDSLYMARIII